MVREVGEDAAQDVEVGEFEEGAGLEGGVSGLAFRACSWRTGRDELNTDGAM